MIRRCTNVNSYEIETQKGRYAVTMQRLKNSYYGNPRFKATIITLDIYDEPRWNKSTYLYSKVYTFNGHYMSEQDEAKFIADYAENN